MTLERGELPATELLPEYFQPKQRCPEARSEEINSKRSSSINTKDTDDGGNTQQQKNNDVMRRQMKENYAQSPSHLT